MTVWEFLTSLYFWVPATTALVLYKMARNQERKAADKINHPSAKWQKHDRHYQKKYGINS